MKSTLIGFCSMPSKTFTSAVVATFMGALLMSSCGAPKSERNESTQAPAVAASSLSNIGTSDVRVAHSHFTFVDFNGASAEKLYVSLARPERPTQTLTGEPQLTRYSKDGRLACTKKLGQYSCALNVDTASGNIYQTYL